MLIDSVICVIFVILPVYNDDDYQYPNLTHTALQKVPAVLGESAQIRCSKIIQNYNAASSDYRYDNYKSLSCNRNYYEYNGYDELYGHNCKYTWKRNGAVLNDTDSNNYDIKSFLTFNYCENFEGTTDLIKEMNISVTEHREIGYERNQKRIKCFSSVLTIHNVTKDDLGKYECGVGGKWDKTDALNITVFNAASGVQLPKQITYFEKALNQGLSSKVLMQCVVESGSVYWFIGYNDLDESPIQPIEKMVAFDDVWRCFDHISEKSHKIGDITESFIFFENVCLFDAAEIYCSADSQGKILSMAKPLKSKRSGYDINHYYIWEFVYRMEENLGIVIPTLVILFFSLASVLACCRGGLCHCCGCSSEGQGLCPCCSETSPRYSQIPNIGYTTAGNAVCPVPSQAYNALPSTVSAPTAASLPPRYVPPNEIPA